MKRKHFDVSALQKAYERDRPGLEHALERVHALAVEVASVTNKWQLARIRLTEARIKLVESLERKARKNRWDPSTAVR